MNFSFELRSSRIFSLETRLSGKRRTSSRDFLRSFLEGFASASSGSCGNGVSQATVAS
jgi:hypothetical protein